MISVERSSPPFLSTVSDCVLCARHPVIIIVITIIIVIPVITTTTLPAACGGVSGAVGVQDVAGRADPAAAAGHVQGEMVMMVVVVMMMRRRMVTMMV